MSALDMVLQRQVPARPVAKTGEGSTGADAAGDTRKDAFSAALSNEKRSAAAERDKVESTDETEVETGAEADDATYPSQSDEILNLLSGLMSSASYAEGADLGNTGAADGEVAEAAASVEAEVEITEKVGTAIQVTPDLATAADVSGTTAKENGKANSARGVQAAAQVAQPASDPDAVAAARAGESQAMQTTPTAKAAAAVPAAQVSAAAVGLAAQGPQTQPKASDAGSERQKDQSSVKEAMRALGMEAGRQPVEADAVTTQTRDRGTGKQGEAGDRRLDELAGSKGNKVEVIESRRFMPVQGMSANGQLLTRSLVEAGSSAMATHRAASALPVSATGPQQAGQTLHTLKLQLNPVSLGSVTAVLKLSGDELSVAIQVQTAEAYRQIKEDNQAIVKALRGQGFGVEQITVQHVAGPDRASSQTPQQGFQSGQQGAGSSDAQSSGKESGRNTAGQQGSGGQGGRGHEQGSYAGSGTGRTDGVYL